MKLEKTCKCIKDYLVKSEPVYSNDWQDKELEFHKEREYQVDCFPLYYQLYQNGGWDDYTFLNEEEFNKYFVLIE